MTKKPELLVTPQSVAHVEALLKPEAGNKRFIVSAPEKVSYQRVADITRQEFDWAKDVVRKGDEGAALPLAANLDGSTAEKELGFTYRSARECIVDTVRSLKELEARLKGSSQ